MSGAMDTEMNTYLELQPDTLTLMDNAHEKITTPSGSLPSLPQTSNHDCSPSKEVKQKEDGRRPAWLYTVLILVAFVVVLTLVLAIIAIAGVLLKKQPALSGSRSTSSSEIRDLIHKLNESVAYTAQIAETGNQIPSILANLQELQGKYTSLSDKKLDQSDLQTVLSRLQELDTKYKSLQGKILEEADLRPIFSRLLELEVMYNSLQDQELPSNTGGDEPGPGFASYIIPGGMTVNTTINITAVPGTDDQGFAVNLKTGLEEGADIALHFNARFSSRTVVCNTYTNGHWGGEQITRNRFPFQRGAAFDLLILCDANEFQILINNQEYTRYSHRGHPLNSITSLYIRGFDLHHVQIE